MSSKKHRDFLAKPMKDKRVTKIPGIGDVLGRKLENAENVENRFQKAYAVFGQYLLCKEEEQRFKKWLETTGANSKHQDACDGCLTEWFLRLPMEWNMEVTELPGFNRDLGIKLNAMGFTQAYKLFGQYLVLKDVVGKFEEFLSDEIKANEAEKNDCINFLEPWCHQFLNTDFWAE